MDTATAAEQSLIDWATTTRDRDTRILRGLLAGLTKYRIHQLIGGSRNTIEKMLEEHPVVDTAAVLRAMARANTGMTAAEFDHSLSAGDGTAVQAMHIAAWILANEDHPESDRFDPARAQRTEELWDRVWPEVEAMISRAKQMKFLGWSTEAKARGQKIRYAPQETT
jgi:hypothetical protein